MQGPWSGKEPGVPGEPAPAPAPARVSTGPAAPADTLMEMSSAGCLCQRCCCHPVCTAEDISGLARAAVVRGLMGVHAWVGLWPRPTGPHASGPPPIPQAPRVSCLSFWHAARAEPALGHVVTSVDMDGQPFVQAVLPACRAHVGTAQPCPQLPDGQGSSFLWASSAEWGWSSDTLWEEAPRWGVTSSHHTG